METNNFEDTLRQLETRVDKLSGVSNNTKHTSNSFSFKGITVNKRVFGWIGLPLGIMVILLIVKPKIVREEAVDEEGTVYEFVSKKRIFIATFFISALVVGCYGVWKYKKSNVNIN